MPQVARALQPGPLVKIKTKYIPIIIQGNCNMRFSIKEIVTGSLQMVIQDIPVNSAQL